MFFWEEDEKAQVKVRGGGLAAGKGVEDVEKDGASELRSGAPS